MTTPSASNASHVRLAELLGALSLAMDLGLGQPMEHLLQSCLLALRLGQALGLPGEALVRVYWLSFLRFLGCTAASEMTASLLGDDVDANSWILGTDQGDKFEMLAALLGNAGRNQAPLPRARLLIAALTTMPTRVKAIETAHCEAAQHLAGRFGFPPSIVAALGQLYERWDGKGSPHGIRGDTINEPLRVVQLAQDALLFHRLGGVAGAVATVRRRSGGAYEPRQAETFCREAEGLLAVLEQPSIWEAVQAAEPKPWQTIAPTELNAICRAIGDFADLKSPYFAGHSSSVAALAAAAAGAAGLPDDDVRTVRRAGLVQDLGRVGVSTGIWNKRGSLTTGEWERIRLHPYYTVRVLSRCQALAPLGRVAACHHERQDGSGYHHALANGQIPVLSRILAAADAYQALIEPRPHRLACSPEATARELTASAAAGALDPEAVGAVLSAAGHRHRARLTRPTLPYGLTEREVEVLRLLARGYNNRQAAGMLVVAPATVDHHIRHIYDKLGVSTRAAATLVASQHELLEGLTPA